jgi:hypothetical protein
MYLANKIDEVLESKKQRLMGNSSYYYICDVLNRGFKRVEPFSFRFETYADYDREDFSVAGLYDMESDRKYVILNFAKKYKAFKITEKNWKDFKFATSQVCQHELIHQLQWNRRPMDDDFESEPLEFRNKDSSKEEEREYLSDVDEIDAYGHDIAMEIRYFYPNKNPYSVLRSLSRHRKVWSYRYYKDTFKGGDWCDIRKRLLKKTYMWLPYVTV